jgi:hypothetical protein
MQRINRWMLVVVVLILTALPLAACGQAPATATKIQPATVEKIAETGLNRLVLTEKAAQRLAIQTTQVREEQVNGSQRKVIPYAALIYDLKGATWTYTNPAPLTFVREAITVDHIEGDKVVLMEGPAVGTAVVTVGVAELYGTDTGIGK